jgi:hypothetical protein
VGGRWRSEEDYDDWRDMLEMECVGFGRESVLEKGLGDVALEASGDECGEALIWIQFDMGF